MSEVGIVEGEVSISRCSRCVLARVSSQNGRLPKLPTIANQKSPPPRNAQVLTVFLGSTNCTVYLIELHMICVLHAYALLFKAGVLLLNRLEVVLTLPELFWQGAFLTGNGCEQYTS